MKKLLIALLISSFLFSFAACTGTYEEAPETDTTVAADGADENGDALSWDMIYDENTTIGEGERAVTVKVILPDKDVELTLMTDETMLGAALVEAGLVEGEDGPYGLYIKKVNGIGAVYETDGAYWAVSVNGVAAATGADSIALEDGVSYELTYTEM